MGRRSTYSNFLWMWVCTRLVTLPHSYIFSVSVLAQIHWIGSHLSSWGPLVKLNPNCFKILFDDLTGLVHVYVIDFLDYRNAIFSLSISQPFSQYNIWFTDWTFILLLDIFRCQSAVCMELSFQILRKTGGLSLSLCHIQQKMRLVFNQLVQCINACLLNSSNC